MFWWCCRQADLGEPGTVYGWLIKKDVDPNVSGSGTVVAAFPYEVFSVPLSKAFAQANQSSLFATLTSTTPATVSAIKTALSTATGKETTCKFVSSGLNSVSLVKPTAQVINSITGAYVSVNTYVLGNQAGSGRPLQP